MCLVSLPTRPWRDAIGKVGRAPAPHGRLRYLPTLALRGVRHIASALLEGRKVLANRPTRVLCNVRYWSSSTYVRTVPCPVLTS
eukprot:612841-Rhodomonas_salina.1